MRKHNLCNKSYAVQMHQMSKKSDLLASLTVELKVSWEDIRIKPEEENNANSDHDFMFGFEWWVLHFLKFILKAVSSADFV